MVRAPKRRIARHLDAVLHRPPVSMEVGTVPLLEHLDVRAALAVRQDVDGPGGVDALEDLAQALDLVSALPVPSAARYQDNVERVRRVRHAQRLLLISPEPGGGGNCSRDGMSGIT